MRNSQRDFRSLREWACRVHVASKQTQVAGACCKKSFRAHIRQLNTSCKRITAGAVESRANGTTTSLFRILSQAGYSSKEYTPIHALHSMVYSLRSGTFLSFLRPSFLHHFRQPPSTCRGETVTLLLAAVGSVRNSTRPCNGLWRMAV